MRNKDTLDSDTIDQLHIIERFFGYDESSNSDWTHVKGKIYELDLIFYKKYTLYCNNIVFMKVHC